MRSTLRSPAYARPAAPPPTCVDGAFAGAMPAALRRGRAGSEHIVATDRHDDRRGCSRAAVATDPDPPAAHLVRRRHRRTHRTVRGDPGQLGREDGEPARRRARRSAPATPPRCCCRRTGRPRPCCSALGGRADGARYGDRPRRGARSLFAAADRIDAARAGQPPTGTPSGWPRSPRRCARCRPGSADYVVEVRGARRPLLRARRSPPDAARWSPTGRRSSSHAELRTRAGPRAAELGIAPGDRVLDRRATPYPDPARLAAGPARGRRLHVLVPQPRPGAGSPTRGAPCRTGQLTVPSALTDC